MELRFGMVEGCKHTRRYKNKGVGSFASNSRAKYKVFDVNEELSNSFDDKLNPRCKLLQLF